MLGALFGFERSDAVDSLLDGQNDRSVDAVAFDGNRLIVLQAKYNSHEWAEVTKFQADIRAVLEPDTPGLAARLRPAAAKLRDARYSGLPIQLFYVTNQRFSGGDDARIGSLSGDPAIDAFDLDGICAELTERESDRPLNAPSKEVTLRAISMLPHGENSLLVPVDLVEFAQFVDNGQKWLFDSNVRQYLSKSRINVGIRDTVKKSPERFWTYNNGVTMVVDDFRVIDGDTISLAKPQIVNGCQTSLSVSKVIMELDSVERSKIKGSVLVRIVRESSNEERRNITQFTNRQNAVRGKDFFALKDFQQRLKQRIDKLGYFYEIQTGSFDMQPRSVKEGLRGDSRFSHLGWTRRDFKIPAIEAAKCHAAALRGFVSVCYSNPGELAPNGDKYDAVFPADLPDDPDLFLIPFLVLKHAEHELGYGATKGESWRRRGRYVFVWATFRVLSDALQDAKRLETGTELGVAHTSVIRNVFASPEASDALLKLADRVLDGYFSDSAIEKLVNADVFAFLKGPIEKKDAVEILDGKIRRALDGQAGGQLVELLKATVPA